MKFKLNDHVAVYDSGGRNCGHIEKDNGNGTVVIWFDKFSSRRTVYVKQCRLLKKKERRRIWVNMNAVVEYKNGGLKPYDMIRFAPVIGLSGWTEFIEVKKT